MVAFWAPEEYEPVVVVRCSLAIIFALACRSHRFKLLAMVFCFGR